MEFLEAAARISLSDLFTFMVCCLFLIFTVVISACKEPIAGYVENIYSLAGLAAAYALGINRVNYFKDGTLDVIPVDYVVNLLIASGWYVGVQKIRKNRGDIIKTEVVVCNCISSQSRVLTTQEWFDFTETAIKDVPSAKMIQCPLSFNTSCYYNYKLITFLLHTLMGFLCDAGLKFCGKQSGIVQGYEKMHRHQEIGSQFLMKQFYFSNSNTEMLLKRMSFRDREIFNFDISSINWEDYFASFARGIRVYILKDPMSTLPEGRKRQSRKLKIQLLSAFFTFIFLYVAVKFVVFRVFF